MAAKLTSIANPFLDEVRSFDRHVERDWMSRFISDISKRLPLVKRYSWAIPNDESIRRIVACGPVVEVAAGNGYWASLVRAAGGDIVACDTEPGSNHWCDGPLYFDVVKADAREFVLQHQDRALMFCWPFMDNVAYVTLQVYTGSCVVYIGESDGGCCANAAFFELLYREFEEIDDIQIPQFYGLHDRMNVYRRLTERSVIVCQERLT